MRREIMGRTCNAGKALQALVKAEPWFGIGVLYLLTPRQWDLLRSGRVFEEISGTIERIAEKTHRGISGGRSTIEDAITTTLLKLVTREFLNQYDAAKGPPKGYMLGVARNYLIADQRSLVRASRHEGELKIEQSCDGPTDPTDDDEIEENSSRRLSKVMELIDSLSLEQQEAIKKRYLANGDSGEAQQRGNPAEYRHRCRGLKKIREQLRRLGYLA